MGNKNKQLENLSVAMFFAGLLVGLTIGKVIGITAYVANNLSPAFLIPLILGFCAVI